MVTTGLSVILINHDFETFNLNLNDIIREWTTLTTVINWETKAGPRWQKIS